MEGNLTFLQDVQDAYATLSELTIVITDLEGNEVTNPSGITPLTKIAFEKWITKELYQSRIQPLAAIRNPSVYVNHIGLKVIVSPIQVNGQTTYYVFAGALIRDSTRTLVRQYIKNNYKNADEIFEALELTPELSETEIKAKMDIIQKLSQVVRTYLTHQTEKQYNNQKASFIHQSLESVRTGTATTCSFIEELFKLHRDIDFIGLAIEDKSDQYVIETIHGDHTDKLKGHAFLIGEGFLGHTIATEQFQFWQNVQNDPRTHFFKSNDLDPKSLFCVPIYGGDRVTGILFGGSSNVEIKNENVLESFKVYSSILNTLLTSNNIKHDLQNHLMELSTFNEIFRVITTVKDMKRVLYILVDISINITRGPFTCIVFKPNINQSKVDIVSRGLVKNEINDYCYDVAIRAFSNSTNETNLKQPFQNKTNWGTDVMEFPLLYKNRLYGMLCVGLYPKNDPDKYKAFLSTLSVAGSISFHLCQNNNKENSDEDAIQLLQDVMNHLNKEKHMESIKIESLVKDFTGFINEEEYTSLKKVCRLVCYNIEFIEKYINDQEMLSILVECQNVLQNQKANRRDSEILGLLYHYVTQNENIDTIKVMSNVNEDLRTKFVSYINQHSIVETEISFDNGQLITSQKQKNQNSEGLLKKELNLSSREVDVLNHILKGYNNREIAANLFISEHTVKNHITKILQKLEVSDRAQAIAKVYQLGYSPPN
ncbi:LuxR C-terminal-related transcriptional regulator [Alkalihalobacillus sp. BA299]|uniref:LuxR C-terminal-related transcriptional regulator n=1 Tax=Alkalihalobacillus sp. BA299 TaxID=2815938 RepID=UPI001ADB406F|nr:LuxR C-terminal-related transcriptional regulator [Alkalihalobacillus sp. BA299]